MSDYKQTPLGLIPREWRLGTVEDFGVVVTGATPSTVDETNFGSDYMFVTPSDLGEMKYIRKTGRGLTEKGIDKCRLLPPGSILFVSIGSTIGKVGISTKPCASNQQINAVVPKLNHSADYLYYCLQLRSESIARLAGKQAVPIINKSHFSSIPLAIPPETEQASICSVLNHWDRAIDITERLIATKQTRRTWLMQQLLTGKRRLPGFAGNWRLAHLGDVFTNRVETGREDLPLIAITGENGVVNREEVGRKDTSSEDKSRYLRIAPGDIGYNTMRMWQGVCGLSAMEGIVSPAYTIVTPKASVDGVFMALFFKSPAMVHLFHRHSQGLVDDTLNLKWKHFAQIKATIPDKAEQQAIAKLFCSFDRELNLLRAQLVAMREQKKGLMQQLLTGKISVSGGGPWQKLSL